MKSNTTRTEIKVEGKHLSVEIEFPKGTSGKERQAFLDQLKPENFGKHLQTAAMRLTQDAVAA